MPRGVMTVLAAADQAARALKATVRWGQRLAASSCPACRGSCSTETIGDAADVSHERGDGRFMRMLVFFDLPVTTKADRKAYAQFRKFLVNDGYDMLQFQRVRSHRRQSRCWEKHYARVVANLPPEGSVRVLTVTEKQYASMKILVGLRYFRKKGQCQSNVCCSDGPFGENPRQPRLDAGLPVGECSYPG